MKKFATWSFEVGTRGVLVAGRWLQLRAILWAMLLFAAAFGFFLSTQYIGTWLHLPANAAYAVFLGIPVLALIAYASVVRIAEKRRPIEVLPGPGMITDLLIGASIGFAMLCTTTALLWSLGLYQVQQNQWRHVLESFVFGPYLSGVMEELLFRAILLRIFARAFGAWWGLVLSSVLFGLAHIGHGSWLAPFEIMISGGFTLGLLYMVTGRIWMSIGMHIAWDFTEDSILGVNNHNGWLLSTPVPGKPGLLTGGSFGPDGSLLGAVIGILVCFAILWFSKNHPSPERWLPGTTGSA